MIHILFQNTLYLDVTRYYREVFVDKDLTIHFAGEDSITLRILDHPTVREILNNLPEDERKQDEVAIVYQVFNMLCQRFTGKSLVDGVLIPIENDVLNLDGALRNLRVNKEEKKDGEGNK